jgi:hypothetical protein
VDEFDGRPAPLAGCHCEVCAWCRATHDMPKRLIRPDDSEWKLLLWLARDVQR